MFLSFLSAALVEKHVLSKVCALEPLMQIS